MVHRSTNRTSTDVSNRTQLHHRWLDVVTMANPRGTLCRGCNSGSKTSRATNSITM
jgi:hypothetical protein